MEERPWIGRIQKVVEGGEEEAQSPNIVGATNSQALELKTKPGEVKQSSGVRKDFHASDESNTGTKKPPQDNHRPLPSSDEGTNHPESPSGRAHKRKSNRDKGAAGISYEPGRLPGELRYGGKRNWSMESDDGKGGGG